MSEYQLNLDTFKGPLEKLVELIEAKELEITRLNLAEVTADFLEYMESLGQISSRVLSDFVAVAARLILIKSNALLPQLEMTEEEEEDILDLENRLKLYKEFRSAEECIGENWQREVSFARKYLIQFPRGFYLNEQINPKEIEKHIARLCSELETFFPKTESVEVKLVTLEEKIEELVKRVDNMIHTSFNEMVEGKEQSEIIVLFLALLHLLKENVVYIRQEELFGEIHLEKS